MQPDIVVLTPEKTVLTFRLAGLGHRCLAHVLDLCFFVLLLVTATFVLDMINEVLARAALPVLATVGLFAYFIVLEWAWKGCTLGKSLMGLRVRMADGTPITPMAALGRNLLRPADMLPGTYLLGLLCVFIHPKGQRIGDLVAGTVVCAEAGEAQRFIAAPHQVGIHPLEDSVGELRGMTLREYMTLRRLADRFPYLDPASQSHLLKTVWCPIADRRKVPRSDAVEDLYLIEAVVMKFGRRKGLL